MEGAFERPQLNPTDNFAKAATIRFAYAVCSGMVGIAALVGPGVHTHDCYYVGWVIRVVRTRHKYGPPMAAKTELSRLFVMRNDEKFLRHVKWALGASE